MRRLLTLALIAASLGLFYRGPLPCGVVGRLAQPPRCLVGLIPGPSFDVFERVSISGIDTTVPNGRLLFTTIQLDENVTFAEWVKGPFDANQALVDREVFFPRDETELQSRRRIVADMHESQLDAIAAALTWLAVPYDLHPDGASVVSVTPGSAADGVLRPRDIVVAFAGEVIADADGLNAALDRHAPGDQVVMSVERGGLRSIIGLVLGAATEDPAAADLGVLVGTYRSLPFDIDIDAGAVGGPSAGLMFSLAIVDLLWAEDVAGGQVIAGTGTIAVDGSVGAIGGIQQKIRGASGSLDAGGERDPATVFLVPTANFQEARGTRVDRPMLLVPVASLDAAVAALLELRDGRTPVGAYELGGR